MLRSSSGEIARNARVCLASRLRSFRLSAERSFSLPAVSNERANVFTALSKRDVFADWSTSCDWLYAVAIKSYARETLIAILRERSPRKPENEK